MPLVIACLRAAIRSSRLRPSPSPEMSITWRLCEQFCRGHDGSADRGTLFRQVGDRFNHCGKSLRRGAVVDLYPADRLNSDRSFGPLEQRHADGSIGIAHDGADDIGAPKRRGVYFELDAV